MSKIHIMNCGLCGKDVKAGFILGQGGAIVENHPFYEMYLVYNDLSKVYKGNDIETLMCIHPICEECFKKINYGNIIKENEELKNKNEKLVKENYDLIRDLNEVNGDMDRLM